ncbi:PTS system mannose/fructose/sorbose family transporter subunit IID, partial [Staphylococcus pseudintermedius]
MTNSKTKHSKEPLALNTPFEDPTLTGSPPKEPYQLTKKDFRQINLRSLLFFQWGWNYERMQGSGYLFTILPQLRKIYGDNSPELKEMMRTHAQFFNT